MRKQDLKFLAIATLATLFLSACAFTKKCEVGPMQGTQAPSAKTIQNNG